MAALRLQSRQNMRLAAEAAHLAQKPDKAAIKITHLGRPPKVFVSRGQEDCNRFVINFQAVNDSRKGKPVQLKPGTLEIQRNACAAPLSNPRIVT